jgi:hypothetical protein
MAICRSRRKLHKQRLLTQRGYTVYAVDALAVRDHSQACEEFGNFAVHDDLPRLISKGRSGSPNASWSVRASTSLPTP